MKFIGDYDLVYFEGESFSTEGVSLEDLVELFRVNFKQETVFKIADCFYQNSTFSKELTNGIPSYFFLDFYHHWNPFYIRKLVEKFAEHFGVSVNSMYGDSIAFV